MSDTAFDIIRLEANKIIAKQGEIDFAMKKRILDTTQYIESSTQLPKIVQILSEIICAEEALSVFPVHAGPYFDILPFTMLDAAKIYLGSDRRLYQEEIKRLSITWDGFCDGLANHEFNGAKKSLFFYPPDISDEDKSTPMVAILSVKAALSALFEGEVLMYRDLKNSPDQLAVDWASEVTSLSKKEFWLWYVNEAFPKAIAEAPKYLKQGDS